MSDSRAIVPPTALRSHFADRAVLPSAKEVRAAYDFAKALETQMKKGQAPDSATVDKAWNLLHKVDATLDLFAFNFGQVLGSMPEAEANARLAKLEKEIDTTEKASQKLRKALEHVQNRH